VLERVLNPEDEGSKVFRNTCIIHHHYTTSQPRRPRHKSSPWKPQISQITHCLLSQYVQHLTDKLCHQQRTDHSSRHGL